MIRIANQTRVQSRWSPMVLAPSLWLRADLGVTIATGVSSWADQSGNGNHFTQGTGSRQPTVDANTVGGQPSIRFTTANDLVGTAASYNPSAAASTTMVICRSLTSTGSGAFEDSGSTSGKLIQIGSTSCACWPVGASAAAPGGIASGLSLAEVIHSGSGANGLLFRVRNLTEYKTATTTAAFGNNATARFRIGYYGNFNGYISEVIVVPRLLTSSEKISMSSYMNARYGAGWGIA